MGTIKVSPAALIDARAHIVMLGQDLRRGLHSTSADIGTLLGRGWTGAAAVAFEHAWQDWQAGSMRVLDALDGSADLLLAAAQEYDGQEARTRTSFAVMDAGPS